MCLQVGKTEHHVRTSKNISKKVWKLMIAPKENLRSYDVSVNPVDRVLVVIKDCYGSFSETTLVFKNKEFILKQELNLK